MGAHLGLLASTTDTGVTDNANSVAGGEATDSDGEAGTEIDEGFEQGVFGLHAVGDEDGDDEAVDGNDTGHDNRNHGLHHQLRVHDGHVGDPDARLGGTVASAEGCARGNTQRGGSVRNRNSAGFFRNELASAPCLRVQVGWAGGGTLSHYHRRGALRQARRWLGL